MQIVNARNYRGPGAYIGRPHPRFPQGSPLGNPYRLRTDTPIERARVLIKYRRWLRKEWLQSGPVKGELQRLAEQYRRDGGLTLVCWCAPARCHGETVAHALREIVGEAEPELTAPLRLLITGSRQATPEMLNCAQRVVAHAAAHGWQVLVGDAPGVDAAVIRECDRLGVPVKVYGAHGKLRRRSRSGQNFPLGSPRFPYLLRDIHMAAECDLCLAIWDGHSAGTHKTFTIAREMGKQVHLKTFLPSSED